MADQRFLAPYDMLRTWAQQNPDRVYLRQPVNRVYLEKSWSQVHDEVLRLAAAFRALGLRKGDVVAILGKNTAEWFITDFAISAAGLISAPIYSTAGANTIRYVLEHSEAKAIVVGKLDDADQARKGVPEGIITIAQPYPSIPCDHQMTDLIARHPPLAEVYVPQPNDTFSIIYTSGTTGHPKGIVISYRNIGFTSTASVARLCYTEKDRLISYLPLAHITERAMVQYVSLYHGCSVAFTESLETFPEDIRNAQPTVFISVPRLWSKFQSGILGKMPQKKLDRLLSVPILRGIVKNKIKKQLGLTHARIAASGAAPISPAVLAWFARLGIHIVEGFGMSETSGLVTVNHPFRLDKIGTVGPVAEGTKLRIAEDGELLVGGEGISQGYYKEPEKTAETFKDGWLHTGDKGEIDADGCLKITGRMKEIFKTGKGKYVAPVPIESLIAENPDVEQACVMGGGLPQPVAVVVMSARLSGKGDRSAISEGLAKTLVSVNARLESHEKISHFLVAKEGWTIENGLLTPTMKTKRNLLEKKYSELLERPVPHGSAVVFEHADV